MSGLQVFCPRLALPQKEPRQEGWAVFAASFEIREKLARFQVNFALGRAARWSGAGAGVPGGGKRSPTDVDREGLGRQGPGGVLKVRGVG